MSSLKQITTTDASGLGNRLYVVEIPMGKRSSKDDDRGLYYKDSGKDYGSNYSRNLAERKRGFRR